MSLAAGVLSAALALPPQGLVAAYDFARVNLLNWSEDTTNATWARQGMNITPLTTPAPYPYSGAPMRLTQSAVSGRIHQDTRAATPGQPYTASVWLRADTPHDALLKLESLTGGNALGNREQPVSVTTAWQRFAVTMSHVAGGDTLRFLLWPTPFGGPVGEVEAFGIQLNAGGTALDYERTTDAQILVDRSVRLQSPPLGRVNQLGFTEELNLAPWTLTNATLTPAVADPFGGTRAFTLTGLPITSGPERRLLQNAPPATAGERRVNSVYLRRRTGVGAVQMLTPQNSAWIDLALTGTWQRFTTSGVLGSSASLFALRLLTDGDQVDVAFPQQEAGAIPTAYERQFSTLVRDQSLKSANMAYDSLGGSTSSLPPGWAYGSEAGITHAITAVRPSGTVPGTAELDFTVSNNDTVNRTFRLYPTPSANTAAGVTIVPGEVLSWSAYLSTPDSSPINVGIYSHDTSHSFLANTGQTFATSPTLTKYGITRAIGAGQATASARGVVEFGVGPGSSRSFTLAAPMFNRGPELPYVRPAQHATLGSSTGPDSNDPTWVAQGLSFDGVDDRIITPISPPGLRSFTLIVAALLRPGAASPNSYADALGWRNTPARGWVNLNVATGAQANWEIRDGATTQVGSDVTSAGAIVQGQYAVYALSVDRAAGTARAFQNGLLTRARTLTAGLGSIDADSMLLLGTTLTGGKTPLTLSYAAIYDRALTDAEAHQAYRFIRNQLSRRGVTI